MASQNANDGTQMFLFEAVQTAHADGTFTVKPKRIALTEEIDVKRAAKILRMHADTVRRLCELGEENGGISAYKTPERARLLTLRLTSPPTLTTRVKTTPPIFTQFLHCHPCHQPTPPQHPATPGPACVIST